MTTTTTISDHVILRYCGVNGWDDEKSKNYCDESRVDIHTTDVTIISTPFNTTLVIMIGIILIGLLLLMCVGLCVFQRMEVEDERLRQKLAEMEESSTSGSVSETDGEEG